MKLFIVSYSRVLLAVYGEFYTKHTKCDFYEYI